MFEQMQYFGLSFLATLVPIRREEDVVKTYLNAKWETCLRGLGQASTCFCLTDANTDAQDCVVPGQLFYLNMGETAGCL